MELISDNVFLFKNRKLFSSNTYLLKNNINQECIIIDPGLDYDFLSQEIKENGLIPIAIISTHGHFDHIGCVQLLKNEFNIPFYLHELDLKLCKSANFYLKIAKLDHKIESVTPDFIIKGDKNSLYFNGINLTIYNFPGHSPGSCVLESNNLLFTGDIIYKNGLGKGSMPKEDLTLLKKSLIEITSFFKDDSIIFPGHGDFEVLSEIKNNNTELQNFLNFNNSYNE